MIMCVGVPLRARTVLEMVHLDGRAGWRARELRARYLRCCCEHLLCAKGSHDASVRLLARVENAAAVLAWSCHSKPV